MLHGFLFLRYFKLVCHAPWIRPPWIRRPWIRPPWIRPPWNRPPWNRPPWNRPAWIRPEKLYFAKEEKGLETVALVRVLKKERLDSLARRRLADRERARARRGSETATLREVRLARHRIVRSIGVFLRGEGGTSSSTAVTQQQRIATEEREARLQKNTAGLRD